MVRLYTALIMTLIALGSIATEAHRVAPEESRKAVKLALTTGLAIAAGFAWERTLHEAFESLGKEGAFLSFDSPAEKQACDHTCAEKEEDKLTIMMDAASVGIALPSLYYHIAPTFCRLKEREVPNTPRSSELRDQSDLGAGA
jgi:hypothetical protein